MMNEIVLFETKDKEVKLSVAIDGDDVWLNRQQMAELFDRDIKTIGKHINNALKEELDNSVVAKFATTAKDGKIQSHCNFWIDMITRCLRSRKGRRNTGSGVSGCIWRRGIPVT